MISEKDISQLRTVVNEMVNNGRIKELLDIVGVPVLQQLNIEAEKANLSPLVITSDFKFLLPSYKKEILLPPIHKALYILFLNHPEGIEFKRLVDYKDELTDLYRRIGTRTSSRVIEQSINRLINPLDNSVNEKCARIKATLALCMNQFQLSFYSISGHAERRIDGSSRVWYERKKTITLPRELVKMEFQQNPLARYLSPKAVIS